MMVLGLQLQRQYIKVEDQLGRRKKKKVKPHRDRQRGRGKMMMKKRMRMMHKKVVSKVHLEGRRRNPRSLSVLLVSLLRQRELMRNPRLVTQR